MKIVKIYNKFDKNMYHPPWGGVCVLDAWGKLTTRLVKKGVSQRSGLWEVELLNTTGFVVFVHSNKSSWESAREYYEVKRDKVTRVDELRVMQVLTLERRADERPDGVLKNMNLRRIVKEIERRGYTFRLNTKNKEAEYVIQPEDQ